MVEVITMVLVFRQSFEKRSNYTSFMSSFRKGESCKYSQVLKVFYSVSPCFLR